MTVELEVWKFRYSSPVLGGFLSRTLPNAIVVAKDYDTAYAKLRADVQIEMDAADKRRSAMSTQQKAYSMGCTTYKDCRENNWPIFQLYRANYLGKATVIV